LPFEELPAVRATNRSNAKYVVVTDLSEFYSSIYTHTVPWAIHGKPAAKANRTNALYGNVLDTLLRESQDGQTVGIPIGPDTSLVVAEVVLCAVDKELVSSIPTIRGLRYMDDFELYYADPTAAEHGLALLQETLLEYELRLNPRKTTVEQAPLGIEPEWVHVFRNFSFSSKQRTQAKDLIRYFDALTKYLRENPKDHIVKYALARIRELPVHNANWNLYQALLANAVTVEPGAVDNYIDILICSHNRGSAPTQQLTESTLNAIVRTSAPLGHHHELVWSLWGILSFRLSIQQEAAEAVSKVDNSLVALMALDAERNGLVPGGLDRAKWESRMTQGDLYDDQWLLSYEGNVKGWLPSMGVGDHVGTDQCFGYLKRLGVEFYEPVPAVAGQVPPVTGGLGYRKIP